MRADFGAAAQLAARIAEQMLRTHADRRVLLNVNFPHGDQWAVRATSLGRRIYEDGVEFRRDPRGREYLWIGGSGVEHRPAVGSDTQAYDQGVVGITPLILDLWGETEMESVEKLARAAQEPNTT
jgi:5'-nucleotidase